MGLKLGQQGQDVLLPVKVVPKASRDRIVGELDGAIKIAVSAPPEKGAANEAVRKLLAGTLGLRLQQVQVDSGHASPRKIMRISGVLPEHVHETLVPNRKS